MKYTRTELVKVESICSSYIDSITKKNIDISRLSNICFLTADTNKALHQLNIQIQLEQGTLFVSDMFRSWDMQSKAYQDWLDKKRKDFVTPPGYSYHMAGRAVDIDIYNLNFSISKHLWLQKLWSIAQPLGWHPIVSEPNMALSESWHFQYPGTDWSALVPIARDSLVAQCAILDVGQWNQQDKLLPNKFIQAQLCRVLKQPIAIDGIIGPKTKSYLAQLQLDKLNIDSIADKLSTM